jgi:hypothetical protein
MGQQTGATQYMYFIIDGRNNIQHPTKKSDMIHRWIKRGKARFIGKNLVQVFKQFDKAKTISCKFIIGIDPGYKNIGYSIFKIYKNKLQNLLNGEVTTRTSEITKLLQEKKMYRQNRRHLHRKNILRKFGKAKFEAPRWRNRKKKPWAPTHKHLIQSHLNILNFIFKRINLSESEIASEYFKFDSQKALDPTIHSWKYQKGPQFGFENIKAFVRARDKYTCQICSGKLDKLRVHHIQERHNGGSDRPENLITLCENCHELVHSNLAECPRISTITPMRDSGILNSCMKYLTQIISPAYTITGADTSALRNYYNIEKSHINDAKMIALAKLDLESFECQDLSEDIYMKQYRRHTRNWVKRYEDRKYICDGFTVAWNRKSRSAQNKQKPSLQDFKQEYPDTKVTAKAGKVIYFRANSQAKFRSGDIFRYQDSAHVIQQWASTQGTVTSSDGIKFKTRDCNKIKNVSGLTITR